MAKIIPVIMAGGFGKRLWPLSTKNHPKQFLKIINQLSSLQQTIIRNQVFGKAVVIINKINYDIALQQIQEIGIEVDLIIEPESKNTTPSAVITALNYNLNGDELLLLLPTDHHIKDNENYINTIMAALPHVKKYNLATIGSKITSANPHYGYIKIREEIEKNIYLVDQFKEKPDIILATQYLNDKNYFWNLGIFIITTNFFLTKIQDLYPLLYLYIYESFITSFKTTNSLQIAEYPYSAIMPISLDYAIMEHMKDIILIEENFGWQDLGSFEAIKQFTTNMMNINKHSSSIQPLEFENNEVNFCKSHNNLNQENDRYIFRSWGYFEVINHSNLYQYKIKKVIIYKGQQLSLQYHHHRSEHWVIIKGKGEININHEIKIAHPNDYFYVPVNTLHQIKNTGETELFLIETQLGNYLEEDDIVRIDV